MGLFILYQFDVPVFYNNSIFWKPLNVSGTQEAGHTNSSTQHVAGNRIQTPGRLFQWHREHYLNKSNNFQAIDLHWRQSSPPCCHFPEDGGALWALFGAWDQDIHSFFWPLLTSRRYLEEDIHFQYYKLCESALENQKKPQNLWIHIKIYFFSFRDRHTVPWLLHVPLHFCHPADTGA